MSKTGQLPPTLSLNDVKLRIQQSYSNPNIGQVSQAVLKDGPRAFKIATIFEIVDPNTNQFHHYYLRLDHIDKKKAGWFAKPEGSVRLEREEIDTLYTFLTSLEDGELVGQTGDVHIVRSADYEQLVDVVSSIQGLPAHDRLEFAKVLLSQFDGPVPALDEFVQTFKVTDRNVLSTIAAASRLVQYEDALDRLEALIEDEDTAEADLQQLLQENPWMFGSEYSELLDRRAWTRDDRLDFMLRRTTDGFLEIVEIKKPGVRLFTYDSSHDSYYQSAEMSKVVGQVLRYIEEIERSRDSIRANDHVDALKIRARIIIGRDGDGPIQAALRNLNSHLVRIEMLTFDQLCRVARRVISVFKQEGTEGDEEVPDLPF